MQQVSERALVFFRKKIGKTFITATTTKAEHHVIVTDAASEIAKGRKEKKPDLILNVEKV